MGRRRPAEHDVGARAGERAREQFQSESHQEAAVHDARHYEEVLMQRIRYAMAAGAALFIASATAGAQLQGRTVLPRTTTSSASVPAGMCQIWIDGVPANRQPAPTNCDVARARVPNNGRIIYGTGAQRPTTQSPNTQRAPVYGSNDRYDPRRDPRRDPRNSQYDPRLDRRSSRYDRRYDDDYSRKQAKIRAEYLKKQEKEREQYERKMQRAQEQQARADRNGYGNGKGKGHGHGNGNGGDHDRDHD